MAAALVRSSARVWPRSLTRVAAISAITSDTVVAVDADQGPVELLYRDLREEGDVFWIQGANPGEQHPIANSVYFRQAVLEGATVIQVDPHANKTTRSFKIDDTDRHMHLQLNPGTDIPLLNVVLKTILEHHEENPEDGWIDETFIEERTEGFEHLEETLEGFDKEAAAEVPVVKKALDALRDGKPAREAKLTDDERAVFARLQLITAKPMMYVLNVEESSAATGNAHSAKAEAFAKSRGMPSVVISAEESSGRRSDPSTRIVTTARKVSGSIRCATTEPTRTPARRTSVPGVTPSIRSKRAVRVMPSPPMLRPVAVTA